MVKMTELKTLKDIYENLKGFNGEEGKELMYSRIKKEAIKWVKEDLELVKNELPFGVARQLFNRNIKRFNITSEDLK